MRLARAGGVFILVLGVIQLILMIVLGWDIMVQMKELQRQFLAENWYLLIGTFAGILGGVLLIGSD